MFFNKSNVLIFLLLQPFCSLMACTLGVTSGVNFGNYNPFNGTPNQSNAQIEVTCPEGGATPFTVTLDTGSSGNYTTRTLTTDTYTMNYNIFLNPAYATVWGDGTSGTGFISDDASNCVTGCQYTMYGSIPPSQISVGVGSYSDIINATLSF